MATPILMPKPGQMTEECVLTLWRKEVGDPVHKGDVLFEIETDKSSMEVETFEEGVLLARVVADGETAPVNAVCGWIGQPGEAVPETPAEPVTPRDRARRGRGAARGRDARLAAGTRGPGGSGRRGTGGRTFARARGPRPREDQPAREPSCRAAGR